MVEFGLILPVFFALTVGLIDAGRAFYQYNSLAHAARESARFAAVQGGSQNPYFDWVTTYNGNKPGTYSVSSGHPVSQYAGTATIVGTAASLLPGVNLDALAVSIAAPSGTSAGKVISIGLLYSFQPTSSIFLGGQSFPVTASSRMIIE